MKPYIIFLILVFIMILIIFRGQKDNIIHDNPKLPDKSEISIISNKSPKSLSVNSLHIRYKQIMAVSLFGNIHLEGNKFRLTANSILGKELDLGINNDELWYWSKRSKPRALYYSTVKNMDKTMLKAALNPSWLIRAIGLSIDQNKNSKIIEKDSTTKILNVEMNHLGQNQIIETIIDSKTKKILANNLYDSDGKIIVKATISQHQMISDYVIPKKINIVWYEEGIQMEWTFNQVKVDQSINSSIWKKPDIRPSINIGR